MRDVLDLLLNWRDTGLPYWMIPIGLAYAFLHRNIVIERRH